MGFEKTTATVWASFELGVPWQPVGQIAMGKVLFDITDVIATEFGVVIALTTQENNYQDMQTVIWTGTWDA